jgi:hypothetical protein
MRLQICQSILVAWEFAWRRESNSISRKSQSKPFVFEYPGVENFP